MNRPLYLRSVLTIALLLAFSSAALALEPQAAAQARLGLEQFQAGAYDEAAAAFAAALQAEPTNEHLRFNQACALAAQGDLAEARALWKQSALASDLELAAQSHYNLGCLALDEARALFAANPLKALPEVREQGLQHLAVAAEHYRDSLAIAPQHAEAQHNLELIRSWTTYMRTAWDKLDRQKRRDESDLFAFLDLLIESQRTLRSTAQREVDRFPSPRRWQSVYEAHQAQRTLTAEIEPLKEKITAALTATVEANANRQAQAQAADMLHGLADQARRAMDEATTALEAQAPQEALAAQLRAVESLESIYLAAASYPELLRKAIAVQEQLVAQSRQIVTPAEERSPNEAKEPPLPPDFVDLAHRQRFVAELSALLPLKARALLQQIDPPRREAEPSEAEPSISIMEPSEMPAAEGEEQPSAADEASEEKAAKEEVPEDEAAGGDDTELLEPQELESEEEEAALPAALATEEAQQQAALKKSLQTAIALAPEVERLTRAASDDLQAEDAARALPQQEEALRLLKEMAETLPPPESQPNQQQQNQDQQQDQQQNQDQPQQQNENQQNQQQSSENQPEQSQADSQDSPEPQESEMPQEPGEEQEQQEGSQQEQQPEEESPAQAGEPQQDEAQENEAQQAGESSAPLSEEQAMSDEQTAALLQRVRERQQEHRERMRALERALRRAAPVEKDW